MASSSSVKDKASSAASTEVTRLLSSHSGGTAIHDDPVGCSNIMSSSMDIANASNSISMEDVLPTALLGEIFSFLVDARDISRAALVNSWFRNQCRYTKNVRFNCKLENVCKNATDGELAKPVTPFKETVIGMMKNLKCVNTVCLEIEEDVQGQNFKDDVDKTSLWLSEGSFLRCWLPSISETLTSLTIIDYGREAIYHPSPLLQLLSQHCKQLQTLELRNMFLDSKSCNKMSRVKRLTLQCVKLMENGLQDLSETMPMLDHIVFKMVVGLREARLKSDLVRVLCLGLGTRPQSVKIESSSLQLLQLKVTSPDEIRIRAPNLEILGLRMQSRSNCVIEFEGVRKLKELLMGVNNVSLLKALNSQNKHVEKMFIDVPCMIYDRHGSWRGVNTDNLLPSSSIWQSLRTCSKGLRSLTAGCGIWYCLEEGIKNSVLEIQRGIGDDSPMVDARTYLEQIQVAVLAGGVQHLTSLKQMFLQVVVHDVELSFGLLSTWIKALPSLELLEVYMHEDSNVELQTFSNRIKEDFPNLNFKCDSWRKKLPFYYFTDPTSF